MMEEQLKERLVGASVLVILAIIIIPMVLDGPGNGEKVEKSLDLPESSDTERRTVRIPLNQPSQSSPSVSSDSASTPVDETPEVIEETSPPEPVPQRQVVAEEKPADKPVTAPAEVTSSSSPSVSGPAAETRPWTVQVGSFGSETNAASLVRRLRDLGYNDAYVSRFKDGSNTLYRVRVGGYDSREAAAAAADKVRAKSGEPARPAQNTGDAN